MAWDGVSNESEYPVFTLKEWRRVLWMQKAGSNHTAMQQKIF